jgi:hypothetical protein
MSYREDKPWIYDAPKPQRPWSWWSVFWRVVFPPILAWDTFKWVMNGLLGPLVGRKMLSAQGLEKDTGVFSQLIDAKSYQTAEYVRLKIPGKGSCFFASKDAIDNFLNDGLTKDYADYVSEIGKKWLEAKGTVEEVRGRKFDLLADLLKQYEGVNSEHVKFGCVKKYIVKTDEASLLTVEIHPEEFKEKKSKIAKKHVIYLLGNHARLVGYVGEMLADVSNGYIPVAFDYRNVGKSSGQVCSAQNLIDDTIAQVQRLLDEGVCPDNILLKGHSLGGGIAVLAAKHFNDLDIKLRVFSRASFSNITNIVAGWVRNACSFRKGRSESWGMTLLGYIAWPIIKFVLCATKWEMEAATAYGALEGTKDYVDVRSEERTDPVMTEYGRLGAALPAKLKRSAFVPDDPNNSYHTCGLDLCRNSQGETANALYQRLLV